MKKTLLISALSLVACPASAAMSTRNDGAQESIEFTYAQRPYSGELLQGVNAGKTRVYLGFEMQREDIRKYAGSKVTGFSVYSPFANYINTNTVADGRFFYSFDLKREEYTQDFKYSSKAGDLNYKTIDEPYTITGNEESLYFGYSLVVPKANNMLYIVVDNVPNAASTNLYGTSVNGEMPGKFFTAGESMGALCMAVTLERDNLPNNASFSSFPEIICMPYGETSTYPFDITATTTDEIESVEIEYALGGKPYTADVKIEPAIGGGTYRKFVANVEFPAIAEEIKEQVEFKITKINGRENGNASETADTRIAILEEYPTRQTLYEEYTGTWCSFCPRGYAALEYIAKNYPEFVTASYHYGSAGTKDPMQALDFYPTKVGGFPAAVLNREAVYDPYSGSEMYNYPVPIVGDILARNALRTVWKVDVSHKWTDTDELEVNAEVTNMAGYDKGDYKIAYLLIADGLSGTTRPWEQYNNLSSNAPIYVEELNDFCRGGKYGQSRVKGLVFNDVVVSPDGVAGIDGSLPSKLPPDGKVKHCFTFDLQAIPSDLIPDKKKLRAVAIVLDKNGNVLNCAKDEVDDFDAAGVEDIADENAPVEYFNLNGVKVANPTEGIFIRRQGGKAEKVIMK